MELHIRLIGALAASALALTTVLPGQGYGIPEELIAKRDQKLESEFLKNVDWIKNCLSVTSPIRASIPLARKGRALSAVRTIGKTSCPR